MTNIPKIAAAILAGWLFAAADRSAATEISLALPEAVGIALRNNPALAAAAGRESGAWAAQDRTAAERWPQLRLESRVGHVNEVPATEIPGRAPLPLAEKDTWITAASIQQLVYSGGRVSALVRQAGQSAAAGRFRRGARLSHSAGSPGGDRRRGPESGGGR